ncbi:MAG: mechanosensitive ion channel [Woeseiaceae bacterium]|nr:mechanosensitive ion channel [Woeseiaceae bacterium]
MDTDAIIAVANEHLANAVAYLSQTAIWVQLVMMVLLFGLAWIVSNRVEPRVEHLARGITGMPGLLRIFAAFLRRLEWLFFILFLVIAYSVTSTLEWPGSNNLIYAVMLLSGAWFIISVSSRAIRSRTARRFFAFAAWFYVAAMILGVVDDVSQFLDSAAFSVGEIRISVLSVLQGVLLLAVALWASLKLGNFFDNRIQTVEELTPSLRVLLGKITRIALIVFAGFFVVSGMGIDLTALTVLSGAVGVGIGFGLQKVVSNFISGIIILLDQSIKPGDTIALGDTFGWIRELRARFVSVVTRDGREYLIPNEDFITHEVINWSFSDKYVRLDVTFGVSYDSDPDTVSRIAIEATSKVDRVDTAKKAPVCWLTEFGDSSLNFKLRFWIADPQQGLTNIRGKVLRELWYAFKENDIEIPYPHREVILHNSMKTESS